MIAKKLNLLMKVTNTSNSSLGRALAFDASYISRIRTGKRGLPKNQPFISPVAAYFARNIRENYQKRTIADAVCPGRSWPEDRSEAVELLATWLSRGDNFEENIDEQAPSLHDSESILLSSDTDGNSSQPSSIGLYYGNSGKRSAVVKFLPKLCDLDTPQSLLLYSDESFEWLYEKPDFAKQWAALLFQFISKGGSIKIIHTISRDSGDMLEAVQKWVPLYITGAIKPYFYPKLRDGVYKRTLFIAQGHSALISNSVGTNTKNALNMLIYDYGAVQALEQEFHNYFSLCKPLMQIYNLQNANMVWQILTDFEEGQSNLIAVHSVPSYYTLPREVVESMASRAKNSWIISRHKNAVTRYQNLLNHGYAVTEILQLPTVEMVNSGSIHVPMCDLFGSPNLCYTVVEYRQHILNVIKLLKEYENYNVILSDQTMKNIVLLVKEDMGAIVSRVEPPTTVFSISEQRLSSALWEYFYRRVEGNQLKQKMIAALENYVTLL